MHTENVETPVEVVKTWILSEYHRYYELTPEGQITAISRFVTPDFVTIVFEYMRNNEVK